MDLALLLLKIQGCRYIHHALSAAFLILKECVRRQVRAPGNPELPKLLV